MYKKVTNRARSTAQHLATASYLSVFPSTPTFELTNQICRIWFKPLSWLYRFSWKNVTLQKLKMLQHLFHHDFNWKKHMRKMNCWKSYIWFYHSVHHRFRGCFPGQSSPCLLHHWLCFCVFASLIYIWKWFHTEHSKQFKEGARSTMQSKTCHCHWQWNLAPTLHIVGEKHLPGGDFDVGDFLSSSLVCQVAGKSSLMFWL